MRPSGKCAAATASTGVLSGARHREFVEDFCKERRSGVVSWANEDTASDKATTKNVIKYFIFGQKVRCELMVENWLGLYIVPCFDRPVSSCFSFQFFYDDVYMIRLLSDHPIRPEVAVTDTGYERHATIRSRCFLFAIYNRTSGK
jgi:hypothetical protein